LFRKDSLTRVHAVTRHCCLNIFDYSDYSDTLCKYRRQSRLLATSVPNAKRAKREAMIVFCSEIATRKYSPNWRFEPQEKQGSKTRWNRGISMLRGRLARHRRYSSDDVGTPSFTKHDAVNTISLLCRFMPRDKRSVRAVVALVRRAVKGRMVRHRRF